MPPDLAAGVAERVVAKLRDEGFRVVDQAPSVVPGSGGNREWFIRVRMP